MQEKRHEVSHSRLRSATALCIIPALLALASCSDGRAPFTPPHFVTFAPATGTVSAIQLSPVDAPRVRGQAEIGAGYEGFGLTVDGGFGLAFDTESDRITQIGVRPF